MKNQNQIKVFVSVFLALLSIQGTAMTGAAAMESVPLATEQTEQMEEAVTETMPEESLSSDALSISSNDAIPDIIQGTPLAINGVVKSDFSKITVLTVGVYNAAGEQVIGKTLSPNQVEYDLQNLNDALPFENLQAGTYQYRVTASNATNQNYIVINQSFVVSSDPTVQVGATEDAITIENGSKIPNITVGTSVSISGIVRSASSNITTITVGVYDSNHKMVTGKNAYPTASVFNVKKLDDFVDFSELPVGTYTYEITVTNGTHTNYTVVNQKFTVSSSSTATDDSIKITNNATIPNIMVGKAVSIRGTVTSAKSNITKITVGVFDANNTLVTGNSASPNAKTYNVANMDAAVKFGNLKAGTYYYKVLVTNAAHKDYEVVNQKFIVSESGSSTTTDQIKMTNGVTIPNITAGKSVSIRGTVTSATSNITKLIVGIYREDGTSVTGRTVVPNAKSYDVSKIDPYVKFGGLSAGTYYYKVLVTNATHTNYAVVNQKFTVSDDSTTTTDKLSITGGVTIPNIKVGNVVSIRGTVTSASSNLKSVTVGVYDSNNKLVTGKTVAPNAKTYNVRNLDAYVSFGDLKAGTYYYKVIASNAANTNVAVVNQKFTVSDGSSTTTTDKLSITGGVTIPNIKVGNVVSIRGTVTSASSNLKSVTVGVYDSNNKLVTGKTVAPNAKTYNVRNLDAYVSFGDLKAGTYYYKVIASNAANTNVAVVNQKFTVSDGSTTTTDKLSMTGGITIPNIKVGNVVSIRGTVTSASSNLKSVTVGVYDSNNKLVTGKTATPNAKTYNVRNLDAYVSFGDLKAGTYYYKVIASNAANTNVAVVNQKFTVSDGSSTTTTDKLSITGGVTIPNIKVGNVVSIRGTVTSASSNLKSVTVGVYDSNNKLVTGKTVAPNAKTYNVRNLDAYVSFGDLKAGTYYYKVIASNAANTNVAVVNQKFTVSDGSTTTTDKLSMTGGVTIPNIKVGNVVSIRGTVTSASSNLKSVTVGVYDSNNKLITGKTATPNAKTYNVRNLDAYVSFGDLKAGTYYYKVIASNAANTNVAVVNQKFTVSDGSTTTTDKLSITGGVTIPNIKVGNVVSIRGTVTSASSNLKSVTVGVYDSNNKLVTGKTVAPNAKTYNVRNLDAYVSFGDLKAGTYYYKVIASNAANTNVAVVNQKFTVSDGSTTTTDTLSMTGGVTIPNIKVGNVVSIRGTVTSASSNLKSVTAGVYDSNNKLVTGKTVAPNAKTYNVRNLDAYVSFGDLKAGTYYYKVIASNAANTNVAVVNQKFTVSDGSTTTTDTLSMTGGVTIPNIKVGNVVSIRGTVTSASSNLKSVTVGVYDSNNKLVTGKTATPNAKTYNVRNLDAYVSFGDLKAGTYYYRVFATNATTTNFPVVEQKFTVSANGSTTASDTLSISGGTSVPNITEGTSVVVKGTVSSASSNITSVTVGVYSASGNLITGKTAKPNAKSYDLRKLDAYVNFNLLTPGSYLYRVTVSNGTKTQQLVNQAFRVKAKSGSAQSKDKLTLSGGTTIPNIKVGKAVSIRGTVKSGTSNITSLTVGVFTSSGNLVTGKTVRPNAKSYDIHQVDAYVNFNLLSPDTYYYGVVATNSSYQNQIVSYQKFTVTK
ncbi:beta strand repeat-containing protein [Ruminococcus sp.]|uniref:beta strand repeat-containing protein n=1 Tax=Ruminococcus sp. TaxID=41978 RepID=UPI0039940F0A